MNIAKFDNYQHRLRESLKGASNCHKSKKSLWRKVKKQLHLAYYTEMGSYTEIRPKPGSVRPTLCLPPLPQRHNHTLNFSLFPIFALFSVSFIVLSCFFMLIFTCAFLVGIFLPVMQMTTTHNAINRSHGNTSKCIFIHQPSRRQTSIQILNHNTSIRIRQ